MRTNCTSSEPNSNSVFDLLSLQVHGVQAINAHQELSDNVKNFAKLSAETHAAIAETQAFIARYKATIAESEAAIAAAQAAEEKVKVLVAKCVELHGCLS